MVRQLGGKRFSQVLTALSIIAAPVLLGSGRYFSMNAFDHLFWSLAFYILILIIKQDNPKLWPLFGLISGLGSLNKYSMLFLGFGLVGGLLLTTHRKHLINKWFWLGGFIAFIVFLPHLIWEISYKFPSLEFIQNASQVKNIPMTPLQFLLGQFREVNYLCAPIWSMGLFYFFLHREGMRYRLFGWMYIIIFTVLVTGNAKLYYLSPIYPLLLASGAVFIETIITQIKGYWIKFTYASIMVVGGIIIAPFAVPILPVDVFIKYQNYLGLSPRQEERATPRQEERATLGALPQHYADQFGWQEMVATVADIHGGLSPQERANCMIFVRNYGQAAAIDFFGKNYNLPKASCGHNNYWLWGPPDWNGEVAIILGNCGDVDECLEDEKQHFEKVLHAGTTNCRYCMPYENNRFILLCRGFKYSIKEIWANERIYR
jgi:hypothetical protein